MSEEQTTTQSKKKKEPSEEALKWEGRRKRAIAFAKANPDLPSAELMERYLRAERDRAIGLRYTSQAARLEFLEGLTTERKEAAERKKATEKIREKVNRMERNQATKTKADPCFQLELGQNWWEEIDQSTRSTDDNHLIWSGDFKGGRAIWQKTVEINRQTWKLQVDIGKRLWVRRFGADENSKEVFRRCSVRRCVNPDCSFSSNAKDRPSLDVAQRIGPDGKILETRPIKFR